MEEGRGGVEVGDAVGSRWRLTDRLGHGAFGMVYKAEDTSTLGLGEAAIKVLHPSTSPAERAAFHDEIRKIVALRHPNLVAYLDSGEFHDAHGEAHLYLVTELCAYSLADYLGGPPARLLTAVQAERLLADTAAGLAHIHSRGLLHRDLKPANVLLGGDDWKLGDFGLTRELSATGHYHHGATLMGTPRFMAPELFESNAASPAADVYALGVTFHQALTGRFVHEGGSDVALVVAVTTTAPTVDPGLPPHWRQLIERCVARDPNQRPSAARLPSLLAELRLRPPAPTAPLQPPGGAPANHGPFDPPGPAPQYPGSTPQPVPAGFFSGSDTGHGATRPVTSAFGGGPAIAGPGQAPGPGQGYDHAAGLGQASGQRHDHASGSGVGYAAGLGQAPDQGYGQAADPGQTAGHGQGSGVGANHAAGTGNPPVGPAAYATATGPEAGQPGRRGMPGPMIGALAGLAVIVVVGLIALVVSLSNRSSGTTVADGTTVTTLTATAAGTGGQAPGAITAEAAQARLDAVAPGLDDRPKGYNGTADPSGSDEFCVGVKSPRVAYPGLAGRTVEFANTKSTQLFRVRVNVYATDTEAETAMAYTAKLVDRCNGQLLDPGGTQSWRLTPQASVAVKGADQAGATIQQAVGEKATALGILAVYARVGNVMVTSLGSDRPTTIYYAELVAARANGTGAPPKVEPAGDVGGITVASPEQVRGVLTGMGSQVRPGLLAWLSSHTDSDIDAVETGVCSAIASATNTQQVSDGVAASYKALPSATKGSLDAVDHAQLVGAGIPLYCPDRVSLLQPTG